MSIMSPGWNFTRRALSSSARVSAPASRRSETYFTGAAPVCPPASSEVSEHPANSRQPAINRFCIFFIFASV